MDARRLIDIGSKTVQFYSFSRFPFHEGGARARPSPVSDISLPPLFILPALPLFDLSLLSLVSLLISKDVDFVELPRIPRGFLKRRDATAVARNIQCFTRTRDQVLSYAQPS